MRDGLFVRDIGDLVWLLLIPACPRDRFDGVV